ncbi:MAG: MFS transporter [Burkholderiales bacterium]
MAEPGSAAGERTWRPARLLPIALGTLIVPLDTSLNIAFPAITQAFALEVAAIQWLVVCYMLVYGSLLLVCGRIGDIHGHARVFRLGLAWSAAALVLCMWAPTYGWLLACRALQGVGAALVLACGPALITALAPDRMRARALGVYAMAMALGFALGPLVGGVLVEQYGWQAVFWFRVPIALAALALCWRVLPAAARASAAARFDAPGALLLALALAALLLAVNRLRYLADGDASGLALIALGVAAAAAFLWQQRRSPAPIVDARAFRDVDFALVNAANLLVNFAGFAVLLLAPYYLVRAVEGPLALAGALLAAGGIGTAAASPFAARWVARVSPYAISVLGGLLVAAGLALACLWQADANVALILGALLLQGCGLGLFQVAYMDIVTAHLPREDRGVAGSLAHLTRTVGVLAGATVLSLAFQGFEPAHGFLGAFQGAFGLAAAAAALAAVAILARARHWPR